MALNRFPIEAGHVLMFARAIGDENPAYDPERAASSEAGAVVAPPTFTMAGAQFDPDYILRPKPGEPWMGSGRDATGIPPREDSGEGGTGLHAEQHFTYHGAVRAGDVLSATPRPGSEWEKEGRKGGRLHFSEYIVEYHNQDGVLVVTARSVGVRTERAPAQEA